MRDGTQNIYSVGADEHHSTTNVGIGKTVPDARLDVANEGDGAAILRLSSERAWAFEQSGTGTASEMDFRSIVGNKYFNIKNSNGERVATFYASSTSPDHNRVYLARDGGHVGINVETAQTPLHVVGQGRFDSGNLLEGTSYPAGLTRGFAAVFRGPGIDDGGVLISVGDENDDEHALEVWNETTNEHIFYVTSGGRIHSRPTYNDTAGSAANIYVSSSGRFYRSTSSERYKKDIQDYTDGLTKLRTLRPVTYQEKNKDDDSRLAGFIAEDMHDAGLIEFVDYDSEGRPDALHYGHITALLAKAVQELDKKNTALQQQQAESAAEINALKARISAIEATVQGENAPRKRDNIAWDYRNVALLLLLVAVVWLLIRRRS